MKDIHEVEDTQPLSFNHVHCRGVAARARSVHLIYTQWTGSWAEREGPEHTYNSTILFLKKAHSSRNIDRPPEVHRKSTYSTAQPEQHQKVHNDVDDIPPHPTTTTQPTSCVSEQVHLHTINNFSHTDSLSSSQTVPAIPPGSSTSLTD